MARLWMDRLGTALNARLGPDEIRENTKHLDGLNVALQEKLERVQAGWGQRYVDRVHEKGKLTTWERIDALKDPNTQVFCLGSLVNWGREFAGSKRQAPGAGVVTAFVQVEGRWTILIANDNTVASGAWWPLTPEKIQRAQDIALKLKLPVLYLVDCSGLFLPEQSRSFSGATGAGHIFKKNALLSEAGVPQIAGVFGDCIAGGGYMPIISDRVYMTEGAYMVIAGAALIKGAKDLNLTSLDIGGPEVHVHQSGCADVRVPDDATCLRKIREEVARLGSSAAEYYRHGVAPQLPLENPAELNALFPADHRQVYPIREVIARLVDGSLFHEVMPRVGQEVVVGVGRVNGLWTAFAANNAELTDHPERTGEKRPGGILYKQGIAKLAAFTRACDADGIPLVWLQDIAGFDIGVEAEATGLLSYGSSLIYSISTNRTPMFTVLLRRCSGAGYYAMAGLPYDPIVQLATPISRLAVMEGSTLAIAATNSKLDANFEIATQDPVERAQIQANMAQIAARIETDMDPIAAAARMDADEVVPPSELRAWLEVLITSAYQASGVRRIKNPRIWSLHDLEVLFGGLQIKTAQKPDEGETGVLKTADTADLPAGATAVISPMAGTLFHQSSPGAPPFAPEGSLVEAQGTLGLIEVMKSLTPVRIAQRGRVLRWLVADGSAVAAGQVLAWIQTESP
jgi:3-methylcrotonyl-CoA carboxylase beta subunit